MNSEKKALNHLVVVSTTNLDFPSSCPVCSRPTTTRGFVSKAVKDPLRTRRGSWWSIQRYSPPPRNRRGLEIPVCGKHRTSIHDRARTMTLLTVVNGLAIVFSLFLGSAIAFYLYDGFNVDLGLNLAFLTSLLTMIGTFRALGPSALERAVSIVRFDSSSRAAILRMKHKSYVEELLRLNPDTTRRL